MPDAGPAEAGTLIQVEHLPGMPLRTRLKECSQVCQIPDLVNLFALDLGLLNLLGLLS